MTNSPRCNHKQLKRLYYAVKNSNIDLWNNWRTENPDERIWLESAKLSGLNLCCINLNLAFLGGADFYESKLEGATFTDANLHYAHFDHACLDGADLTNAHLTGAIMDSVSCKAAIFESAHMDHASLDSANFCGANLRYAVLDHAEMLNSNFTQTELMDASFQNAQLSYSTFDSSFFGSTNFSKAILQSSSFKNTKFWENDLENADMSNSSFENTIITRSNIKGASFYAAYMDSRTRIGNCEINSDTDFSLVALDAIQIEYSLLTALNTNIRRKEWGKYYSKCSRTKCLLLHVFWWISDYGSSTSRVLKSFFCATLFFCILYALTGSLAHNVLNGIAIPNAVPLSTFTIELLRCFCFALSTMVTLGFGEININPEYVHKGWQAFALITVTLNLLVGYFLLAVLVTRLGILFQSLAPEQKTEDN